MLYNPMLKNDRTASLLLIKSLSASYLSWCSLLNSSYRFRTSNVPSHGSNGSTHAPSNEHETPRSNPLPFAGSSAHGRPCSTWLSSWWLVAKVDWHCAHSFRLIQHCDVCSVKVEDWPRHTAPRTVYCSQDKIWPIMAPAASQMNWKGPPESEQTTNCNLKGFFWHLHIKKNTEQHVNSGCLYVEDGYLPLWPVWFPHPLLGCRNVLCTFQNSFGHTVQLMYLSKIIFKHLDF